MRCGEVYPDPWRFVLLRILILTVMRSIALGNWVKSILASLLIIGKKQLPLRLKRTVLFSVGIHLGPGSYPSGRLPAVKLVILWTPFRLHSHGFGQIF